MVTYQIQAKGNCSKRTFTLRIYEHGKLIAKYRTIPQNKDDFHYYNNFATQRDWRQFLRTDEYYKVR